MIPYFPLPTRKTLFDGAVADVFEIGDRANTTIMIVEMCPGAMVPLHCHREHQIGLCLKGNLTMEVEDQTRQFDALSGAYFARSGVVHGAVNRSDQSALTLDVKIDPHAGETCISTCAPDVVFMDKTSSKCLKGGLEVSFFVGPWFEIMLSYLPPGALMPRHAHRGIQIGIGVEGSYTMEVDADVRPFGPGDVYVAPEHVPHAGWNMGTLDACSLNLFIPPRWNLLPKRLRA